MADDPESLRNLGTPGTVPYRLKSAEGVVPARLEFSGSFEGGETTWDATVWPLGSYPEALPCDRQSPQFMQIGDPHNGSTPITIGLNIEKLDPGALLMALIMVRKYKRLRRGLICFGRNIDEDNQEI
ncbi:MAG: hypothetical protein R3312_10255 [Gammaproteobacteria bacterium]|nr:hypothetical protein [Gammaproteobacteria bacterium]